MHHFTYIDGILHAEDISIDRIAAAAGTPLYIYSHATLERHFLVFDRAFARIPHITCYSCKANTNIALLRLMARLGGGADIVSGGELYAALRASFPPEKIVFSGVGKSEEEIEYAVRSGIAMINIESEGELKVVAGGRKEDGQGRARIHKGKPGDRRKDAPLHHHGSEKEQVRHTLAGGAPPLPGDKGDGAPRPRRHILAHRLPDRRDTAFCRGHTLPEADGLRACGRRDRAEIHRYRRRSGHYVQERAAAPSRRICEGHRGGARGHGAHARYSSRAGS